MRSSLTGIALLLFCYLYMGARLSHAQSRKLDLPAADTNRLDALIDSIDMLILSMSDSDLGDKIKPLYEKLIAEASDAQLLEYATDRAGKLGVGYRNQFMMNQGIAWHKIELALATEGNLISKKISSLNNLGLIYRRTDKYEASIEAYQEALVLAESSDNKKGIVYALNGLGNIHLELGNYDEALSNFRECLRQEQSANNLTGIALNLNNIGHVYKEFGDLDKAMEYFMLSLEVNQEIPSQRGIAICFNDIGEIMLMKGETKKALEYFELSLNLNQVINDLYYLGINHLRIAEILFAQKDYVLLNHHLNEAIRLSNLTYNRSNLMKSYHIKYQVELNSGNLPSAISYLEKAWSLNDSILNENTQRKVLQMQATFNRERADSRIALLQNEKLLAELQLKRQKEFTWLVVGGLLLLSIGLGLLAYLLITKNKAVNALKLKNREVEQARLQLAEYNNKLLQAKQEAEKSNKLKSQFLANMSHEIRTPLNSVIGFSDLLSERITDPVKLSYLECIRSAGRSLLTLIDDILDLSKIEAGKLKPELHSMSFKNLFFDLRRIFELQAFQKNILLVFDTSSDFPEIVLLHEGSLRQILVNLVGNALKFTENGQIEVKASALRSSSDHCDIHLRVSDTGRGIPEEDLALIFDAFYQSPNNQGVQKGTGLGLTITRRLVELLNGNISVMSELGKGTTFELVFRNVKTISYRTAFRLASIERTTSPVAMICKDNILLAKLDAIFNHIGLTCDLYEEASELKKQILLQNYRLVIWDARVVVHADILPDSGNECKHILLVNSSDQISYASDFRSVIRIPDEFSRLENEVYQLQPGVKQKPQSRSTAPPITDQTGADEIILIEAYHKATKSQLIHDVADFGKILAQYGEKKGKDRWHRLGLKIEQSAQAIDIELMNSLLEEFGELLSPQTENV